jgi:hypothetical protein
MAKSLSDLAVGDEVLVYEHRNSFGLGSRKLPVCWAKVSRRGKTSFWVIDPDKKEHRFRNDGEEYGGGRRTVEPDIEQARHIIAIYKWIQSAAKAQRSVNDAAKMCENIHVVNSLGPVDYAIIAKHLHAAADMVAAIPPRPEEPK